MCICVRATLACTSTFARVFTRCNPRVVQNLCYQTQNSDLKAVLGVLGILCAKVCHALRGGGAQAMDSAGVEDQVSLHWLDVTALCLRMHWVAYHHTE